MRLVDLADELHVSAVEQRFYPLCEVAPLGSHDLRRDLERQLSGARELDCGLRTFIGCDASEEGEISLWVVVRSQPIFRQTVVHRAHPICLRQRNTLRLGNRDEMGVGKAVCAQRRQSGMIQPSVQGRNEGNAQRPQQWDVNPVDMCMYHIEVVRQVCDPREHCGVDQHRVRAIPIQAQRLWRNRLQVCTCD